MNVCFMVNKEVHVDPEEVCVVEDTGLAWCVRGG